MIERVNKEYLQEIVFDAMCKKHDFLILNFDGLKREEITNKIKSIVLNKEKTYIVIVGMKESDIRTEDFLHLYNEVYTSRVSLMIC